MIKDVIIKALKKNTDERGFLIEAWRADWGEIFFSPHMSYVSFTFYNKTRGPHEHKHQTDYFIFGPFGTFALYLWDNRQNSPTFNISMTVHGGEDSPVLVIVPPGVIHGYKCVSEKGGIVFNQPDSLYRGAGGKGKVDEIRHENDPHSKFIIP